MIMYLTFNTENGSSLIYTQQAIEFEKKLATDLDSGDEWRYKQGLY